MPDITNDTIFQQEAIFQQEVAEPTQNVPNTTQDSESALSNLRTNATPNIILQQEIEPAPDELPLNEDSISTFSSDLHPFLNGKNNDSYFAFRKSAEHTDYFEPATIPFPLSREEYQTSQTSIRYDGINLPYSVKNSGSISLLLFICLFISITAYSKGRDYINYLFQNLFSNTDKESIFIDSSTTNEYQIRFSLLLQTTIILAIMYYLFIEANCQLLITSERDTFIHILLFVLIIFIFWGIKWLMNSVLGFIFFEKEKVYLWQNNYFSALSLYGIAFLPLLILVINASSKQMIEISKSIFIFFLILGFIIIIYKGIRFFLTKLRSFLYFMLYLCALEIIPYIGLYMGLKYINEFV